MEDLFAFYGLPLSFFPDQKLIREKYYEYSRKFHPDLSTEPDAIQKTLLNNKGYKTLSSFEARLKYILEFKGLVRPEEKHQLSASFLGEMMDLNERLMDLQMQPDEKTAKEVAAEIQSLNEKIVSETEELCRKYDQSGDDAILAAIKELYYSNKYIQRLNDSIES